MQVQLPKEIIDAALPVECAIARSGQEVMLCLELRKGRTPIAGVHVSEDGFAWECADGVIETPHLTGNTAQIDAHSLLDELNNKGGILVSEFAENGQPVHWVLSY